MGAKEFRRCYQMRESTVSVVTKRRGMASGTYGDSDRFVLDFASGPADVHGVLLGALRVDHRRAAFRH